jgi:hypothetical protein
MRRLRDHKGRTIRLSDERLSHLESEHPEMSGELNHISETLAGPDRILRSGTDSSVELFYKHYPSTPVSTKFLCVVVKTTKDDNFIITAYFTDTMKRGEVLWEKK